MIGCRSSGGRVIKQNHSAQAATTCRVCHFVAGDAAGLRSHLLATHGQEMQELRTAHLCVRCGRRFTTRASLVHHMNSRNHAVAASATGIMTSLRRHRAHLPLRHRRLQLSQV